MAYNNYDSVVHVYPDLIPPEDRSRRESVIKDLLIGTFGTAASAKQQHDSWVRQPQPSHTWEAFNRIAAIAAFGDLAPSVRGQMRHTIKFVELDVDTGFGL